MSDAVLTSIVSIASVAVALAAIAVSVWTIRVQRNDNARSDSTAVIVEMISQRMSDDTYLKAEQNLRESLTRDGAGGLDDLSTDLRADFVKVGIFYESLGALTFIRSVDEFLVVALLRTRIITTFTAMKPYILQERTTQRYATYLEFFESLFVTAQDLTPDQVRQRLDLKSLDPRPAP